LPVSGAWDGNTNGLVVKNRRRVQVQLVKCRVIQKRFEAGSRQALILNCPVVLGCSIVPPANQGFNSTGIGFYGNQCALGARASVIIALGLAVTQPHEVIEIFHTVLDGVHCPALHLRVEGCGDF